MSENPWSADPQQLLEWAINGNDEALGDLLTIYRPYLSLLARLKADRKMQSKVDDSDLVQDTCLSAHRDFAQFRGSTEKEFTAWLREIMAHAAANLGREHRRQRRDFRLERQLSVQLNESSQMIERALVHPGSSPSHVAVRRERAVVLANALGQLSADYREVLVLREFEGKSLAEVAQHMGRTPDAVQKLWARPRSAASPYAAIFGDVMNAANGTHLRRRTPVADDGVDVLAEDRVSRALEEYSASIDAGQPLLREDLLAAYSDVAEELEGCLDSLNFIRHVAPQLNGDTPSDGIDGKLGMRAVATLGDFRIVREIGRGGMGVVYEAEQLSLGRRVALKVLPFAAMLDKQQLARFKNEARAAATLDHPNIVPIHSVGTERGVHFYAMQLVDGRSLAQVIAELRKSRGDNGDPTDRGSLALTAPFASDTSASSSCPAPAASPAAETKRDLQAAVSTLPALDSREYYRAIAALGIQAAEALDHAHKSGIHHRDVKPANLLVDDDGKLWVTDFGLARIEADVGITMTGDLLGTLRYMSPEQALAKRVVVDHRSDIYSLGVTIYELLTLRPAFAGEDRQELLRKIAFEEPRPPRQISARIPLDIETIVLKAVQKNPEDRYATAHEFANDLQRFLEHKLIHARRPSLGQRVVKWARRHVAMLSVAIAALTVVAAACLVAAILILRAYTSESQQRSAAEANLTVASESIDRMLSRVADDQYFHGDLEHAETVAVDATEFYEKLLAHSDDPELQYRAAEAYSDVATIWNLVGQHEKASSASRRAVELTQPLIAAFANRPEYLMARAYGYLGLGEAEWTLRKFSDSQEPMQQAAVDFQYLLNRYPHEPKYQLGLAKALGNLGLVAWSLNHLDSAEQYYRQVEEIERRLPEPIASSAEGLADRAATLGNWAIVARDQGDTLRSMELLNGAVTLQKRSLELWPNNPRAVDFLYLHYLNIAVTCVAAGRQDAAATAVDALIDAYPDRLRAYHDGATTLLQCAELADSPPASHTDKRPQADGSAYRRRARELVAKAMDAQARTPESVINFAWFLLTCDDASFRDPPRAIALVNSVVNQVPNRFDPWFVLALGHYRAGDVQTAEEMIQTATKLIGSGSGGSDQAYVWLLNSLIRACQDRLDEAQELKRQAAQWIAAKQPTDPVLHNLAAEAEALLKKANSESRESNTRDN